MKISYNNLYRNLLVFLFVIMTKTMVISQVGSMTTINTPKLVHKIMNQCKLIDGELTKYIKTKKDTLGLSTEGGEVVKYYKNGIQKKQVINLYGETGKTIYKLYYNEFNELIFISKNEIFYDSFIYEKKIKIISNSVCKYYFYKRKLIRCIDNGKLIDYQSLIFKNKEIEISTIIK
jgi:hypothetical protein